MEELTKTYIYKMVYREIEPIVHNHFNKKQTQEKLGAFGENALCQFILMYLQQLNTSMDSLIVFQKEEMLDIQLQKILFPFNDDNETYNKMRVATLRYFKNKLTLKKLEYLDIFKIIYKILDSEKVYPRPFPEGIIDIKEVDYENSSATRRSSYVWLGEKIQEQLNTVFIKFKEDLKLIDEKTEFIDFYKVFNGTDVNEIKSKINWIGSFRTLIYFIERACHRRHIEWKTNERWKQLEATFICKNKIFTAKQCGNEYSKLNSTEHIPMQGPSIDLIFRSFM